MYSLVQTLFLSQTGPHTGTIPVLFRTHKISLLVLVFEHKAINTKKSWKPVQRHFKPPATAILRFLLETGPGRNWAKDYNTDMSTMLHDEDQALAALLGSANTNSFVLAFCLCRCLTRAIQ